MKAASHSSLTSLPTAQFCPQKAFSKFDTNHKSYLTKTEFKCAFIFLTGFKPSKQDMALAKSTVSADFKMNSTMFDKIMTLYMGQLQ